MRGLRTLFSITSALAVTGPVAGQCGLPIETLFGDPNQPATLGAAVDVSGDVAVAGGSGSGGPSATTGTVEIYEHDGVSLATQDTFEYKPRDDLEEADASATVFIQVIQVDDPPVAHPDSYTLDENAVYTTPGPPELFGLLANDTDDEMQILEAIGPLSPAEEPLYGTLTVNPDGSFTYEHDGSEVPIDSFVYRAFDGTNTSPPVTVTLNIINVNDNPVAEPDAYNADEGATLVVPAGSATSSWAWATPVAPSRDMHPAMAMTRSDLDLIDFINAPPKW